MVMPAARRRSVCVYHLHMGGPNADALQVQDLASPRFEPKLRQLGAEFVASASQADVLLVTGVLTERNLDSVLAEVAVVPSPSCIVLVGDAAITGGIWQQLDMPGLAFFPLNHYADVQLTVAGDPPSPPSILAAISAACQLVARPDRPLSRWHEDRPASLD